MTDKTGNIRISPAAILAGIGSLDRRSLCALIATLEKANMISIAGESVRDTASKLRIEIKQMADAADEAAEALYGSNQKDHMLRHRLWRRINDALTIKDVAPFSSQTARENSAALALRTSEWLSPAFHERQRRRSRPVRNGESRNHRLRQAVSDVSKKIRVLATKTDLVPFQNLVQEEILEFLADDDIMSRFAEQADSDTRAKIEKTHTAAQSAIVGGLGWVAFAGVVANAGFGPYILAAQLSAWVPLVSGPLLVSFLAFIVSPVTVLAGVVAMAWLGLGRQASVVRGQIAARYCVLLSFLGSVERDQALSRFLTDMRRCVDEPPGTVLHANKDELEWWNGIREWLPGGLPVAAGIPPAPLHVPLARLVRQAEPDVTADRVEAATIGAVTAGEIFWHAAAIDEHVLSAADFSRIEDLGGPLAFAVHARQFAEHGADYALRGYTAEQIVLDHLVSLGHHVDMPATSTMPGYDLLVDGLPVQIKCGESLSLLREHFEEHPEIPVIANRKLVEAAQMLDVPWSHMVSGLPGLDLPSVGDRVDAALSHAEEIMDFDVIDFGLAGGWARGGYEVWKGRIPIDDLPAWLIIDGVARSGLAFAGTAAGTWIGLVAVGPAGAVILGPAFALSFMLGTPKVREVMENAARKEWHDECRFLGSELQDALVSALERRIGFLKRRQAEIEDRCGSGSRPLAQWCVRRGFDDLLGAVEMRLTLGLAPVDQNQCIELDIKAGRAAPADPAVLSARRRLIEHLDECPTVKEAIKSRFTQSDTKDSRGTG
ncbi:MAG: hypothetical protein OXI81_08760 [Paracoccaceae bacterium]|nr:hypothetical protein [Paracoccaceae bacterium]